MRPVRYAPVLLGRAAEVEPTVPVTVRYSLTPLGLSLAAAVSVLRDWSYGNMDAIEAARAAYAPPTGAPPTPVSS